MIKQSSPVNQRLEKVVQNYSHLFKEGRGTLQGVKAKIHDSSDASVFYKARPVPYTLRDKIEQWSCDLEILEKAGTIESVLFSEWATPLFR